MPKAILGKKIGMTQIFDDAGRVVPVTVIEAGPCVVVQKRTVEKDGYNAVQLGFGEQKEQRINKPLLGHFRAAGVKPTRYLREVRIKDGDVFADLEVGAEIKADVFEAGEYVDVTGVSKGKGFAGTVKRHNSAADRCPTVRSTIAALVRSVPSSRRVYSPDGRCRVGWAAYGARFKVWKLFGLTPTVI